MKTTLVVAAVVLALAGWGQDHFLRMEGFLGFLVVLPVMALGFVLWVGQTLAAAVDAPTEIVRALNSQEAVVVLSCVAGGINLWFAQLSALLIVHPPLSEEDHSLGVWFFGAIWVAASCLAFVLKAGQTEPLWLFGVALAVLLPSINNAWSDLRFSTQDRLRYTLIYTPVWRVRCAFAQARGGGMPTRRLARYS